MAFTHSDLTIKPSTRYNGNAIYAVMIGDKRLGQLEVDVDGGMYFRPDGSSFVASLGAHDLADASQVIWPFLPLR